jgi:hypothetical protein
VAGYAYLSQVSDANAQKALKAVFDQISTLVHRVETLEAEVIRNTQALNANSQRVVNVGNPTSEQDAVTVAFLRAFVSAQLEAFKGIGGATTSFDTSLTFVVTVQNGLIVSVV